MKILQCHYGICTLLSQVLIGILTFICHYGIFTLLYPVLKGIFTILAFFGIYDPFLILVPKLAHDVRNKPIFYPFYLASEW